MTEQDAHLFYYDKKTRNPNWTDGEIVRFLELLQEEDVMRDLLEHSNKQVSTRLDSKYPLNSTWRLSCIEGVLQSC